MVGNHISFIKPEWPAPKNVKAYTTLRNINLAKPDNEDAVFSRLQLKKILDLPNEPIWLKQTHSNIVIAADPKNLHEEADASFTRESNRICVVLTADCLPLLICNKHGSEVAAIHAGWRGLAAGVIENTITALNSPAEELLVWLGPAIGPSVFEVGEEVKTAFVQHNALAEKAFTPSPNGKWLGNLYALARQRLHQCQIESVYGGEYCTYTDHEFFYSYRREGADTGRMASLIWLDSVISG